MYKEKAIEKIQKELKAFTGGNKEKAVSKPVAETLEMFCKQNEEFAQAIYESDKTLSNCCKTIMEKSGNAISDIEVYKRAVKFYFSTADIEMSMKINLCGDLLPFVSDLTSDDGMKNYGTAEDYVFLLSCDLYRKYREQIPPKIQKMAPFVQQQCAHITQVLRGYEKRARKGIRKRNRAQTNTCNYGC